MDPNDVAANRAALNQNRIVRESLTTYLAQAVGAANANGTAIGVSSTPPAPAGQGESLIYTLANPPPFSDLDWDRPLPGVNPTRPQRRQHGYFVFQRDWPGAGTPGRWMDLTMRSSAVDLVYDWLLVKGVDEHKLIAEIRETIKSCRPGTWMVDERRWYENVYAVLDERIRAQKLQVTLRELREEQDDWERDLREPAGE
ncbi:hypothetical protein B0H67DRAFT_646220 [Lasiosphaeris hirsuta]|uniref:Uncharacterized protein n=1 Tax=Lasiosphaeris hirsuta TaxID=260670 RepID=A0AA40A7K5_9PEZI|nr:hypothetical protein B0H67DRAFT_646220 [Lasiosphaeris hirsuta]